ncbi:Twinfilin-1 [Coemansia sp. RSA 2050]|nr:Twinfilin-1 [Coemansia sp. RSA 2050]KAJ2732955.1 Twinfilin-1 [Coemansia sp. BCRC 34962]
MSTLTSGISATPKLRQFLEESQQGQHQDVSVLRIQIRGEDLVETARKNGPANGDLLQLEEYLGNDPAFFLLRASAAQWYVVTWMPEGKVGVSNRMVYASSHSNLKAAVGADCVADTLQFSSVDEALGRDTAVPAPVNTFANSAAPASSAATAEPKDSAVESVLPSSITAGQRTPTPPQELPSQRQPWRPQPTATMLQNRPPAVAPKPQSLAQHLPAQTETSAQKGVFVKKIDPRLAMSRSELEHVDLLKQEDDARNEQLEQMRSRLRNFTVPAKPEINPDNHHANSRGSKQTVAAASGGFHTVTLPLTQGAKTALGDFASNVGTTVVELQVEANKCVEGVRSYASTEQFSPHPTEPRFYIMRTPGSRIFVYSCPEGSAPRLRMVYSTASAATLVQIQELGCKITHRLSLFSPTECTLIAVAATIRSGQAQRVDTDKSVDLVVNYVPNTPARSLPARFAGNTTKSLDAFTDEDGFRKAFSEVKPNSPAPPPFKATKPVAPKPTMPKPVAPVVRVPLSQPSSDGVDSSPNAGAATWGVQLKPGSRSITPREANSGGNSPSPVAVALPATGSSGPSKTNEGMEPIRTRFSQVRLAGETGNDTPSDSISSSPMLGPGRLTPLNSIGAKPSSSAAPRVETMHSSIPGLRSVSGAAGADQDKDDKWDPWRSVSAVSKPSIKTDKPESSLQSSVYSRQSSENGAGTIADFASDITYPPLQNATSAATKDSS